MKYCKHCGMPLEEGSLFCGGCGASLDTGETNPSVNSGEREGRTETVPEAYKNPFCDGAASHSYGQNMGNQNYPYGQQNLKRPSGKKRGRMIAGILAALAVAAAVFCVYIFFFVGTAKGTAKKYLKGYCDLDFDKMKEVIACDAKHQDELEDTTELSDVVKSLNLASLNMDYEIKYMAELSKKESDKFWDKKKYGKDVYVKEKDVTDLTLCEAKVSVSAKILGQSEKYDSKLKIYLGKYNGKWKVIYTEE